MSFKIAKDATVFQSLRIEMINRNIMHLINII